VLTALVCLMALRPAAAAAPPSPDLSVPCSLSVVSQTSDGTVIPGGRASVYRVASWKAVGTDYVWAYTAPYAACPIPTDGLEDNRNAVSLASFTAGASVTGLEADFGSGGRASFTGLTAGLYLIVQTTPAPEYEPFSPFLLALPFYSTADGVYLNAVTAAPKLDPAVGPDPPAPPGTPGPPGTPDPPDPTGTPDPPDPTGTPDPPDPTGTPDPPDPTGTPDPPDPTGTPDPPGPTGTSDPPDPPEGTAPEGGDPPPKSEQASDPGLPQTGQLWWPVPALGLGGIAMFTLSGIVRKKGRDD